MYITSVWTTHVARLASDIGVKIETSAAHTTTPYIRLDRLLHAAANLPFLLAFFSRADECVEIGPALQSSDRE